MNRFTPRVDGLECRLTPTDPTPGGGLTVVATNAAPQIVEYTRQEIGNGLFLITGRVVDESPGGLTVTFGGDTSAAGNTATTLSDGTFSIVVQLRVDGTDAGYLTATVRDAQGLVSQEVSVFLDPTIP
jgi:hypothetical protein